MLALSLHPHLRRTAVAIALLAYAMPLSRGAISQLSHGASHLREQLHERQAKAAAMGLAHLSELGAERSTPSRSFVHTHGGSTHAHAGAVDALLSASDHADDEEAAAVPMVKLSAHTPSMMVLALIVLPVSRMPSVLDGVASDHPRPLPPLPPPRG